MQDRALPLTQRSLNTTTNVGFVVLGWNTLSGERIRGSIDVAFQLLEMLTDIQNVNEIKKICALSWMQYYR